MVKQIFVNLPVKDLNRSMEFFAKLGFTFNPKFTDQNAAAMVMGDNIFAMLILESYFKTFTKKDIADSTKNTEVINALSVENKEKVDEIVNNVLQAGGSESRDVQDYGWMYVRAFEDLDGHLWEVFYMDESKAPKEQ